jgi:hypothetical protein
LQGGSGITIARDGSADHKIVSACCQSIVRCRRSLLIVPGLIGHAYSGNDNLEVWVDDCTDQFNLMR